MNKDIEIITIDGPACSGKGVIAKKISEILNFNYLDSGSMYRVIAFIANRNSLFKNTQITHEGINSLLELLNKVNLKFINDSVYIDDENVTNLLRTEIIGNLASIIGKDYKIREYLLSMQRSFAKSPGLVSDGRDMGSVVFPRAKLKIYLTASVDIRVQRRYKQLQKFNKSVKISSVLKFIMDRDKSDIERKISPLVYDDTFKILDNSFLTIEESVKLILNWYYELS